MNESVTEITKYFLTHTEQMMKELLR